MWDTWMLLLTASVGGAVVKLMDILAAGWRRRQEALGARETRIAKTEARVRSLTEYAHLLRLRLLRYTEDIPPWPTSPPDECPDEQKEK